MPNAKRTMIKNYFVNYLQELYDKGTPVLRKMGVRCGSWGYHGNQSWDNLWIGRIMVEQCKSDNYETSYITFFNERVHLFWPWLVMTTRVLTITRR